MPQLAPIHRLYIIFVFRVELPIGYTTIKSHLNGTLKSHLYGTLKSHLYAVTEAHAGLRARCRYPKVPVLATKSVPVTPTADP